MTAQANRRRSPRTGTVTLAPTRDEVTPPARVQALLTAMVMEGSL